MSPHRIIPLWSSSDWCTLPHFSGGGTKWREYTMERTHMIGKILQSHRIMTYECSLCGRSRGWEEHVPHVDRQR